MDTQEFITGNDKLEFRQIVLNHIKNIINLSLKSNRDGEKLSLYLNSIEALADVLIPFYDEQMEEEAKQFENILIKIKQENSERTRALSPHDYSCKYEKIHRTKKKNAYRYIFRKLNLLLKRNDYLKSSVYGETREDNGLMELDK